MLRSYLLRGINRTNGCNAWNPLCFNDLQISSKNREPRNVSAFGTNCAPRAQSSPTEIRMPPEPLPAQRPLPELLPERLAEPLPQPLVDRFPQPLVDRFQALG